jgi:hypothetical protein
MMRGEISADWPTRFVRNDPHNPFLLGSECPIPQRHGTIFERAVTTTTSHLQSPAINAVKMDEVTNEVETRGLRGGLKHLSPA